MRKYLLAATAAALIAPAAHAGTNVATDWFSITYRTYHGILRPGSPWVPNSTPSNATAPVDGTPQPEQTQWNNGSFWWDEGAPEATAPMFWELQLNKKYAINQLLVQADNNDTYRVDYWNGSAWAPIFNVGAVAGFGLMTRDSGVFAPIFTDRFRFQATGGDLYYSLGQFQAIGTVPEPASWAMLIAGFSLVGAASRRRRVSVSA
ncbi:PEPxxWA-CTERM sorting domain-containing protein [Sandarakinorhabdus oryzae]|uniref:PEPxxWA-CTERM sorting domain-containing protein n=1 Tax=Sandarakinorhabdus oryzae TaxID=2675220 RepID=UPI001F397F91|nr:PEPxxWA-CTERM sorting domain-containing protein [Sandarakinorhabdus oryzae]